MSLTDGDRVLFSFVCAVSLTCSWELQTEYADRCY